MHTCYPRRLSLFLNATHFSVTAPSMRNEFIERSSCSPRIFNRVFELLTETNEGSSQNDRVITQQSSPTTHAALQANGSAARSSHVRHVERPEAVPPPRCTAPSQTYFSACHQIISAHLRTRCAHIANPNPVCLRIWATINARQPSHPAQTTGGSSSNESATHSTLHALTTAPCWPWRSPGDEQARE